MALDPALVHPTVLRKAGNISRLTHVPLLAHERIYADTLLNLDASLRSPAEMSEASEVLNALLDARTASPEKAAAFDVIAARAFKAAQGVCNGRSGMAVDLCLDYLRLAFDDAQKAI